VAVWLTTSSADCGVVRIRKIILKLFHPVKIGLWCAVSRLRFIGPALFAETVNVELYRGNLMQFIALLKVDGWDAWFQQHGSPVTPREQA